MVGGVVRWRDRDVGVGWTLWPASVLRCKLKGVDWDVRRGDEEDVNPAPCVVDRCLGFT